ncbi:MAG: hypothetical protein OWQ59_05440, partial [Alicyclobacillaceae bacterium]|nr:hypothetical protein [Alicyclobacillaceae bacterium]
MTSKRLVRSREENHLSDTYLEDKYQVDTNRIYHDPERLLNAMPRGIPSEIHYRNILCFLWTLENMVPIFIQELHIVAANFTDDVLRDLDQMQQNLAYDENLQTFRSSRFDSSKRFYQSLREWGVKYHLADTLEAEEIYLSCAIQAIKSYKYPTDLDPEEMDRKTVEL